ncbi:MAPEG family protein [Erythrobacter alti]|uniref:MAPEG family protein n=1 Tax=Erythrobacter alti TaxID=1896145 RepID=UPI0030F45D70
MAILQPVVALLAWTMVIWLWMYATRLPAMSAARIDPDSLALDPDASLDKLLSPQVQWKAHNYNHLHEAPTLFYAVALVLALLHSQTAEANAVGAGAAVWLAWVYVAFRVLHSLVQVTINKVLLRFSLFSLSQIALLALIVIAAMGVSNL